VHRATLAPPHGQDNAPHCSPGGAGAAGRFEPVQGRRALLSLLTGSRAGELVAGGRFKAGLIITSRAACAEVVRTAGELVGRAGSRTAGASRWMWGRRSTARWQARASSWGGRARGRHGRFELIALAEHLLQLWRSEHPGDCQSQDEDDPCQERGARGGGFPGVI
jgi:hypothetical protein